MLVIQKVFILEYNNPWSKTSKKCISQFRISLPKYWCFLLFLHGRVCWNFVTFQLVQVRIFIYILNQGLRSTKVYQYIPYNRYKKILYLPKPWNSMKKYSLSRKYILSSILFLFWDLYILRITRRCSTN